jgi:hypothetical protein
MGGFTMQKTTITITFSPQDGTQIDPTYLMQASQVGSVRGNVFEGSPSSDEGYSGDVRTRESSVWDEEW